MFNIHKPRKGRKCICRGPVPSQSLPGWPCTPGQVVHHTKMLAKKTKRDWNPACQIILLWGCACSKVPYLSHATKFWVIYMLSGTWKALSKYFFDWMNRYIWTTQQPMEWFRKLHSTAEVSGFPSSWTLASKHTCSWHHCCVTLVSDLTSLNLSVLVHKMDNFLGCYEDWLC